MSLFSPQQLLLSLQQDPVPRKYWVAYSGGVDSTVLLHAMAALQPQLSVSVAAIHIDHCLHPNSSKWSGRCQGVCQDLSIPLQVHRVDGAAKAGESPEAAARHARYGVFSELVGAGEVLLTAHHLDDQGETLVLQLLRGAGVHGLASMPGLRECGAGALQRPLLDIPRQALIDYATEKGLSWIDDPSNFDISYERNFIRHEMIPMIEQHRGAEISKVIARSAGHLGEAAQLLDQLAEFDLAEIGATIDQPLPLEPLRAMESIRRRNLLRHWIRRHRLPAPATAHLRRIEEELLSAGADKNPLVGWQGAEIRRYRDRLYMGKPLAAEPGNRIIPFDESAVQLPGGLGVLNAERRSAEGIKASLWHDGAVTVRFRNGGERCSPQGRGHTHELKKLFQEYRIPPWWRSRWPLIYCGEQLAAVPGLFYCNPYSATAEQQGVVICWEGRPQIF